MFIAKQQFFSSVVFSRKFVILSFLLLSVLLLLIACSETIPKSNGVDIQPTKSVDFRVGSSANINNRIISGNPITVNPSFDLAKFTAADFSLGGQLYDSWFSAQNLTAPSAVNSIWGLLGKATTAIDDTWRCSSCHGWDYLGVNGVFGDVDNLFYTEINGVVPEVNQISEHEIWTFIRDGSVTDSNNVIANHDFINQLTEGDIYALTKFIMIVREENSNQSSPLRVVNNRATISGDQSLGAKLYNTSVTDSCISCHGISGNDVTGVNIRQAVSNDPAKALHKIRFGMATISNPMPGVIATLGGDSLISLQQAGDITTYAVHGIDANPIKGGRLYDDWIIESGIDVTTLSLNPLWDLAQNPGFIPVGANTDPVESWRCVNCHTYYYEGGNGFYFNDLMTLKEDRGWTLDNAPESFTYLYDFLINGFPALLNGTVTQFHNYGQFVSADTTATPGLVDADLWNLADFLVEETVWTNYYILPDIGTAYGGPGRPSDFSIGLEFYTNVNQLLGTDAINCSMCHGLDGLGIATVDLASLAWDDPWMFFHRARFGTPRSPDSVLTAPFDTTATIMPGMLEFTKPDGVTPSDNDDVMHTLYYIQLELNGFTPPP